jgi:bifunctional pyridoxal-dependent enzyme with beta-cystathionase and maltose regulon repressor activities
MVMKTKKRTKVNRTTSPPQEIPVLDPAILLRMEETLEKLHSTAQWIESTVQGIQNRLRHTEAWFREHNPEVRLNGSASAGYLTYVAQPRK